jgi:hypothetical protein
MDECALRRRVWEMGYPCDEERCPFWQAFGYGEQPQCAVQYFHLLEGEDSQLAEWLLGLRESQIQLLLGKDAQEA